MPHQCVRCSTVHEDESEEILKGCSCGGKLFSYVRDGKATAVIEPSEQGKNVIGRDVRDIVGKQEFDQPVDLDLESIRISQPGKYEVDLAGLMKGDPVVYRIEQGKYVVDLVRSFGRAGKKK